MKISRMLVLLSALALLAGLVGCNSHKGTDMIAKTVGDTSATEYQAAEQIFSDVNDMGNDGIGEALGMVSEVVGSQEGVSVGRLGLRAANVVAADTLTFHMGSGYWYRVHSQVDTEYVDGSDAIKAIIEWFVRDSLQFRHGLEVVVIPDSALLTELRFGRFAQGWNVTDADSLTIHQLASMVGDAGQLAGLGDVVINSSATVHGSAQEEVENLETSYQCTFNFDLDGGWDDVALNMHNVIELGDCPSAGSITLAGSLSADCFNDSDSVQFNGGWTGSLTYANGTQTAVFENETTRWTQTTECGITQPLAVRFR